MKRKKLWHSVGDQGRGDAAMEWKLSRLPRYGWYLYDFGNSILIINGGLYFPQWLVTLNGVQDFSYNFCFILSSILILFTAPLIGLSADYGNRTFKYLLASSLLLVISGIAVGCAPFISDTTIRLSIALVGFFFVLVSYQLSLVFYNTLLGTVSDSSEYESVSGRGLAWGWFGGIVGILFGLPFSLSLEPGAGINSILPSALVTGGLTSISLYLISRGSTTTGSAEPRGVSAEGRGLGAEVMALRRNTIIWTFLLSYFLFSDAILTIQNNSTIYMEVVLKLIDREKAYEFLLILITSALGSLASVPLAHLLGLKRALLSVIGGCAGAVLITPLFTDPIAFTAAFGVLGLLNGGVWNLSRVLFYRLIPDSRRNTYFGFYSTFERFSSIVGPITWSIVVSVIQPTVLRYQMAWMTMGIFLVISLGILARIKFSERPRALSTQ
jgi:MFS transporter, UMF1 family